MQNLDEKIYKIKQIFEVDNLFPKELDARYIQKYYKINKFAYSFIHSRSNLIHMAISRDGIYKDEDLLEPAKFVNNYIKDKKAINILELACGRGANIKYLAENNQDSNFIGIDISNDQLNFANQKIKNARFMSNNYHNLSIFKQKEFNLVYIIEAICYSQDFAKVFEQVHKVLDEKGIFIVFDGFLKKDINELTENELIAKELTEKGMACESIQNYKYLVEQGEKNGFDLIFEEDVSKFILPNLYKFERLARKYFKFISLAKILKRILPKHFLYNAFSGYLMPNLVEEDVASYNIAVFRKK